MERKEQHIFALFLLLQHHQQQQVMSAGVSAPRRRCWAQKESPKKLLLLSSMSNTPTYTCKAERTEKIARMGSPNDARLDGRHFPHTQLLLLMKPGASNGMEVLPRQKWEPPKNQLDMHGKISFQEGGGQKQSKKKKEQVLGTST